MAHQIFGAGNKGNPGNTIIGGSSVPKEKRMKDIKLSARKAKSNMPTISIKNDASKKIVARIDP